MSTFDILGLDGLTARLFGQHKAALSRSGETLADADLMITAIAVARGAELATGNIRLSADNQFRPSNRVTPCKQPV